MFDAPTLQTLVEYNLGAALPAIWLAASTMILLLVDVFLPEERQHWTPILALSLVTASFVMAIFAYNPENPVAFDGMFTADPFTGFLNIVILATTFISILLSTDYLERSNINNGEFYTLLLLSASGVMFMVAANDLIVVFIGLELLSIPLYVLAAFHATNPSYISQKSALVGAGDATGSQVILRSEESGVKYFILGAFSSAFLVYGAALMYGATGTTNLEEIFASVSTVVAGNSTSTFLLLAGTALVVVGLGFKVAAVPFHMWTPDVYEGSPTPITAYMSVAAKVGAFAALLRIVIVGLPEFAVSIGDPAAWQLAIQIIAVLTLILGNFVAVVQTNVKRMLAYSSIAHAGYILLAVAAVGSTTVANVGDVQTTAAQAALVYMIAYMFTNLGAFAVVMALEKVDGTGTDLEDFVGLFNTRPQIALAMTVFMLSLTGIPLTGGFLGKWLVFGAAVQANLIPLAIIGVLTSVVSAFYYMRIVVNMFLRESDTPSQTPGLSQGVTLAIYTSVAGVLVTGIVVPLVTNLVNLVQFG